MENTFVIKDGFWKKYQQLICENVIPYQQKVLGDEIPGVEKSHAIENFKIAAGDSKGEFYGWVFQDSDLAKWIEAAAYSLILEKNPKLEAELDKLIDVIGRAQDKDGYLDTYFMIAHPERRWQNLQEGHELYCSGHMIEAAVAYYEATGKKKLLEIMEKNADCIYNTFGKEKRRGFPGHPEIELALVRLYRATGKKKYLELSEYFIDERGTEPSFYEEEKKLRDWTVWNADPVVRDYTQSYAPVREQKDARGHAVRAVYLYTGMADVAKETGDKGLFEACENLWSSITDRQMYVSGGIGSTYDGEAFTADYDLPNDTDYSESCASIGLIFFAKKMLEMDVDSKYSDVMERALYNCVLSGMSLDGKNFFYVNPMEVNPEYDGKVTGYKHVLPTRPSWYGCACCPPNIARLISSLGRYVWTWDDSAVYSHLFIGGELDLTAEKGIKITQETSQPYGNIVKYTVSCRSKTQLTLAVRIPDWSMDNYSLTVNGEKIQTVIKKGYAYITRQFADGDTVELALDVAPKKIYSNVLVRENQNGVAIQRGPILYCIEGVDNPVDLRTVRIKRNAVITELPYDGEKLGGIVPLDIEGVMLTSSNALYSFKRPEPQDITLHAVPYNVWCNRGENQMAVWLKEE